MPVPLGSKGQPDFTQPIELMMDCHRRVEHFLGVLQRVTSLYARQPLDRQGREALETALNYFQIGTPRHTEDEEDSLFPRLRASDDPRAKAALVDVDRLESDHRIKEKAHEEVEELGRRWLVHDQLEPAGFARFEERVRQLSTIYARHIPLEDNSVFQVASEVLTAEQLREIGEEMKARRVNNPGRKGSRCAERRQKVLK